MGEYLFKRIDEVLGLLNGSKTSLFLDYDGTLTGITGRPEDARLTFQMRELVRSLAATYPLAIISGRSLADIMKRVNMDGVVYAGNHGLEISADEFTMVYDTGRGAAEDLEGLRGVFRGLAGGFKGLIMEDKGTTLTLHYRLLDARDFVSFKGRFDEAVAGHLAAGRVRLTGSKKAFEIRANVRWDKGRAVEWLMDRPLFKGTTPLYIGDDDTDRDAYRAIGGSGVCVNVGRMVDEAPYFLMAQSEVAPFLRRLLRQPAASRGLIQGA